MHQLLRDLGRSLVKLLVCVAAGIGVGMTSIGVFSLGDPDFFRRNSPPPSAFLSGGLGLLTTAGLLGFFFLWPLKNREVDFQQYDYGPRSRPREMTGDDERRTSTPHSIDDSIIPDISKK